MKRLAIIPAREGSKRIPHKNIRDFCGKPMVSHTISTAADSGIFDTIHVSTDSKEVSDIATKMGHGPDFMRPSDLSGDHTSMMEVLTYVVTRLRKEGKNYNTIALLYATSPLTDAADLSEACKSFENGDTEKPLLAVAPFPAPIEHAFRMKDDGVLIPDNEKALAQRTQDLRHAYYDAGMFAFYTSDYIVGQSGGGNFAAFRGYVVPSYRVTDIDWPDDWDRAEMLFKTVNGYVR